MPTALGRLVGQAPRALQIIAYALPAAITLHGAITFTGAYRWIADFELGLFDEYHPKLCFVFGYLAWSLLSLGLLALLLRLGVVPRQSSEEGIDVVAIHWGDWLRARFGRIACAGAGVVLLFMGGREALQVAGAKVIEQVDVGELARGKRPQGTWLELTGSPVFEHSLSEGHDRDDVFVPVVPDEWDGHAVFAVLRLRHDEDGEPAVLRGIVDVRGLPALVEQVWREAGIDASQALVLELGIEPDALRMRAQWSMLAGAVLCTIAGLIALFKRLRQGGSASSG